MAVSPSNDRIHWKVRDFLFDRANSGRMSRLPSRLLVVDWGISSAVVSQYHQSRDQRNCLDSFKIVWNENDPESIRSIGEMISNELVHRNISTREVIASIPRRFVVLKNLSMALPDKSEVADAVFLQCENLFPVSRSTLAIDFIENSATTTEATTSILVAAAPNEVVFAMEEALRQAQLRPLAIGVAEIGLPYLTPIQPGIDWQLDLLISGASSEFLLSHKKNMVISHTAQLPSGRVERLQLIHSTIERLLQAAHLDSIDPNTISIQVYGKCDEAFQVELQTPISIPIVYHTKVEPSQIKDLALLASYSSGRKSIDLIHPRQPNNPQLKAKRRVAMGLLMACLVLGLLSIPWILTNDHLNRELDSAIRTREKLDQQIERSKPIEKSWKQLTSFERSKLNWAQELRELVGRLKPNEQMVLQQLEISEVPSSGMAVLRIKGRAKNRETFALLTEELLATTDRYRLRPPILEETKGDEHYSFGFTVELELTQSTAPIEAVSG